MKKLIISLIIAVLLALPVRAAEIILSSNEPVEHKVVELHATHAKQTNEETSRLKPRKKAMSEHWTCSGAFVDAVGDILTARHCTEDATEIEVVTYDGQTYTATVVSTSTAHDLALIHIDRRDTPFFRLAESVTRGEVISILGSPLAITNTLMTGRIAKIAGDLTLVDCTALPGDSGAAVYDSDGRLIGILTGGYIVMSGATGLNYAQSLDAIGYFLVDALERGRGRAH